MALASLNKHTEAVGYYKKALELDPDNDTYKTNLKIAEEKMETSSPVRRRGVWPASGGGSGSEAVLCVRLQVWAGWTWPVFSVTPAS